MEWESKGVEARFRGFWWNIFIYVEDWTEADHGSVRLFAERLKELENF